MRAILIDPFEETVTEVEYSGNYKDIYKLLETEGRPFTVVYLPEDSCLYLDDEGLFQPAQRFFRIPSCPSPLAGRGLILGEDEDGENVATELSLDKVRESVTFLPHIRFMDMEETIREGETPFGPGTIIERKAVFGNEN